MTSYARIPQGKVGRISKIDGEVGGLCVSPVSGHAVIVIKGTRDGKDSLSLIHYSKHTPTHILNVERNSFSKDEKISVYVYFNHLKTNPALIDVLRALLQESSIEHELREFPEKQKALTATFESVSTFDANDEKVKIVSHDKQKEIKQFSLLNQEFKLLEGLVEVGKLTVSGKISHVPGEGKYIKYDGDIYRHPSELANSLVEGLDCTSIIYNDGFKDVGEDDAQLGEYAEGVTKELVKEKCTSEEAIAEQLNRILTSRTQTLSPRAMSTNDHPFFSNNLIEAAHYLVSTGVVTLVQ